MDPQEIKRLVETGIPGAQVRVSGSEGKYEAVVISPAFEELTTVKRHQLIYGTVNDHIASGALHALTIKAYTPEEWRRLGERA
jgi:acid stress-induced BolA-like protein IbaG/YrbA